MFAFATNAQIHYSDKFFPRKRGKTKFKEEKVVQFFILLFLLSLLSNGKEPPVVVTLEHAKAKERFLLRKMVLSLLERKGF